MWLFEALTGSLFDWVLHFNWNNVSSLNIFPPATRSDSLRCLGQTGLVPDESLHWNSELSSRARPVWRRLNTGGGILRTGWCWQFYQAGHHLQGHIPPDIFTIILGRSDPARIMTWGQHWLCSADGMPLHRFIIQTLCRALHHQVFSSLEPGPDIRPSDPQIFSFLPATASHCQPQWLWNWILEMIRGMSQHLARTAQSSLLSTFCSVQMLSRSSNFHKNITTYYELSQNGM